MSKKKPFVVLSLFDGVSCGQVALNNIGIKPDKYYASEIDKFAIQVTQHNYPNTIQLGDVCDIKAEDFDEEITLLHGGSPCQGFSFAGDQLAFDDPRSKLFFEFVRLVQELKPKYWMLENVPMKQEFEQVITEHLFQYPHKINASLVSAQSRKRLYWTNIPLKEKQPKDKGILLKDILEPNADINFDISEKTYKRIKMSERGQEFFTKDSEKIGTLIAGYHHLPTDGAYIEENIFAEGLDSMTTPDGKAWCVTATYGNAHPGSPHHSSERHERTLIPAGIKQIGEADINGHDHQKRIYDPNGKAPTLTSMGGGNLEPKVPVQDETIQETKITKAIGGQVVGRAYDEKGRRKDHHGSVAGETTQMLEPRSDEKSNALTTVSKSSIVGIEEVQSYKEVRTENAKKKRKEMRQKTGKDYTDFRDKELVPRDDGKIGTLTPNLNNEHQITETVENKLRWRRLTPKECERLQGLPDDYTSMVSNTQRYRQCGNGWCVPVIEFLYENLIDNPTPLDPVTIYKQTSIFDMFEEDMITPGIGEKNE
tara:strand:+ start:3764 stop:5377 length:1614 start_codon:yes stop_codon:yes gene_type:complete